MRRVSSSGFRAPTLAGQRGVALVIVLWLFVFLFVMALHFAASMREEAAAAHRYAEEVEAYYLAVAGFEHALYELLHQEQRPGDTGGSPLTDLVDGSEREARLGKGLFRVRLVDEMGKINLNRINEETLRRIFTNLGIEEPTRSILIDSILDWRDEDDLHRVNGAESDYYLSLPVSYSAKNGPFDAVEDLLWVRGATPELFYGGEENGRRRIGFREIFTLDNPLDRVNLRTAPAEVIHALTGIPLEKSRHFVEERKRLSEKTLADLVKLLGLGSADPALQQFVFINPSVVSIESTGLRLGSVSHRKVKGVVRMTGGNRVPDLLRWVDRDTGFF